MTFKTCDNLPQPDIRIKYLCPEDIVQPFSFKYIVVLLCSIVYPTAITKT